MSRCVPQLSSLRPSARDSPSTHRRGNLRHATSSSHVVESGHARMPSPTMVVAHMPPRALRPRDAVGVRPGHLRPCRPALPERTPHRIFLLPGDLAGASGAPVGIPLLSCEEPLPCPSSTTRPHRAPRAQPPRPTPSRTRRKVRTLADGIPDCFERSGARTSMPPSSSSRSSSSSPPRGWSICSGSRSNQPSTVTSCVSRPVPDRRCCPMRSSGSMPPPHILTTRSSR